jgi:hypothetical protein
MHNTNWRGSLGQLGREGTTSSQPYDLASMFNVDVACKTSKMEVSSYEIRA